jgi:acylphosphatase
MTACQEVNVYIKRELRRKVMQRLIAYVSGKVQKSGYRARVVTIAQNLRLKGYVQNLEDGRVKVVAEGESFDLEILLRALDMKEYSSSTGDFEGFFKVVSGGGETDQRLDVAAEKLTEFVTVNREILMELKANRQELKETRGDIRDSRDAIVGEVSDARDSIVGEIGELRADFKESIQDRLIRIESDVSLIKAKVGL